MKLTIEINNKVLVDCLNNAHSRYWAVADSLHVACLPNGNILGHVTEQDDDHGSTKHHHINGYVGLQRLFKYNAKLFARVISGESDGPDADVFLQLCAGLMYNDGPKYG